MNVRRSSSLLVPLLAFAALPALPAQEPGSAVRSTWTYEGATGPESWAALYPEFAACGSGTRQSPIDLTGATSNELPGPDPWYGATVATRLGTQWGMVLRFAAGSAVELDGNRYELMQAHAHAPSEHTIDGRRFPAEIHLVHRHASGQVAVLAVLLDEGAENGDLAPLLPPWPQPESEESLPAPVPTIALVPASFANYRYEGSITTPPCTEGVRWIVFANPLPASPAQLTGLAEMLGATSRPVQPRNGREIYLDPQ